jgi:hypothetical protein
MRQLFTKTWLLCGTLDATYATVMTLVRGGTVQPLWIGVAAGPSGDAANNWGWAGALLGLAVHFGIMAAMVGAYLYAWPRMKMLEQGNVWLLALLYGVLTYLVMYWVILPLRWPEFYPTIVPFKIALGLAPHILFVGIPLALMTQRNVVKDLG